MNIFFLDKDPVIAAQSLCNSHVVKMGLEACQLLSTAHRVCPANNVRLDKIYELTHKNHPCSIWVRESTENYKWLWEHAKAIFDEYYFRYGKIHACVSKGIFDELFNLPNIPNIPFTTPALAMPDDCKLDDYVAAYRLYYCKHKLATIKVLYKERSKPNWLITEENKNVLYS